MAKIGTPIIHKKLCLVIMLSQVNIKIETKENTQSPSGKENKNHSGKKGLKSLKLFLKASISMNEK
jgi:hypothetical protein